MTDRELLLRYSNERDQSAFAELARRHGGMVHATARRLAGEDADDVAQAVFILLSQKAARLSRHENIAGWLYQVTRYCANNAKRSRARRVRQQQVFEREAAMNAMNQQPRELESAMPELLDEGLSRLSRDQRRVVLLRYLEGLSLEETATQLGISVPAVAKRSERGLARLREFFAGHGHEVPAASFEVALQSQISPLSQALLSSLVSSITASGGAAAATASASATHLAAKAGLAMTWAKVQTAAAVIAIGATMTTTATVTTIALTTQSPSGTTSAAGQTPSRSTTAPQAPAEPAGADLASSHEIAQNLALIFLTALREREEEAMADLLTGRTRDVRLDMARKMIVEYREGLYARYPQRLGQITEGATGGDEGYFTAAAPTAADVRRLQLNMERNNADQWRVVDAIVSRPLNLNAQILGYRVFVDANPNIPAGTYVRALEIAERLHAAVDFHATPEAIAQQKPKILAALKQMPADIRAFQESLRSTDLAPTDRCVQSVCDVMQSLHSALEQHGADGYSRQKREINRDVRLVEWTRMWSLREVLMIRADAEDEAASPAPLPAALADNVELTLGWDGSKYSLPGPLKVPEQVRQTRVYKHNMKLGKPHSVYTRDSEGNFYETYVNQVKEPDGRIRERIVNIRKYRPDGSIAAYTDFDDQGMTSSWDQFDPTSTRYTMHVIALRSAGGQRRLGRVTFYDDRHEAKVWEVDGTNTVTLEIAIDAGGETQRAVKQGSRRRTAEPAGR